MFVYTFMFTHVYMIIVYVIGLLIPPTYSFVTSLCVYNYGYLIRISITDVDYRSVYEDNFVVRNIYENRNVAENKGVFGYVYGAVYVVRNVAVNQYNYVNDDNTLTSHQRRGTQKRLSTPLTTSIYVD